MPLSEVSLNSIGRNGSVNSIARNGKGKPRPRSPTESILRGYGEELSELRGTPSSLQGMLKNTTETGDIGAFSIRPSRIAQATSQRRPRTPGADYTSGNVPQHQLNQLTGLERSASRGRMNSMQSYKGTAASSMVSMYKTDSQRSFPQRPRIYPQHDAHTYSMSQSSHVSYSLSNHPSYTSLRPRSPFAYPTRLKRPGYRPSSPALVDFIGSDARTNLGFGHGASSPLSMQTPRRPPIAYSNDGYRSAPLLHNPPFSGPRSRATTNPPTRFQTPQPRSGSSQSGRPTMIQYRHRIPQGDTWEAPPELAPPLPMFYDYTEAFEEHQYRTSNVSVLSLSEQTLPLDHLSKPLHEVEARALQDAEPAELPTQKDTPKLQRSNSSIVRSHVVLESPSPIVTPNKFMKTLSEWEKESVEDVTAAISAIEHDNESMACEHAIQTGHRKHMKHRRSEDFPLEDTMGHHILSSSRSRRRESRTSICHTASVQSMLAIHSNGSKSSVSSDQQPPTLGKNGRQNATIDEEPPSSFELKHVSLSNVGSEAKPGRIDNRESQEMHATSSEVMLNSKQLSIHAPVPERPIPSQSHDERYSRILSIDDSFARLAEVVLNSEVKGSLGRTTEPIVEHSDDSIESILENLPRPPFAMRPTSSNYSMPRHSDQLSCREDLGLPLDYSKEVQAAHSQARVSPAPRDVSRKQGRQGLPRADSATYQWDRSETNRSNKRDVDSESTRIPRRAVSNPRFGNENSPIGTDGYGKGLGCRLESRSSESSELSRKNGTVASPSVNATNKEKSKGRTENNAIVPWKADRSDDSEQIPIVKYKLRKRGECKSIVSKSSPSLQSWNLDTSYSWNREPVNIGGVVQRSPLKSEKATSRFPKFKLKITRASSSSSSMTRVTKQNSAPLLGSKRALTNSIDLVRDDSVSTADGGPNLTEYTENAVTAEDAGKGPKKVPHISLRPTSPTLNLADVRSFFSDDSSHTERKGSLRKRFSQLKAIASRANSLDLLRDGDRKTPLFTSGKPKSVKMHNRRDSDGQDSVHSAETTARISSIAHATWKIREKFKTWWHRGEEKLRSLSQKMKKGDSRKGSRSTISTDLYARA